MERMDTKIIKLQYSTSKPETYTRYYHRMKLEMNGIIVEGGIENIFRSNII
jgi:hypothetical protein